MVADIQKIEAAARMSMGYYDASSATALPEKARTGFSAMTYLFAGLFLTGTLAYALI